MRRRLAQPRRLAEAFEAPAPGTPHHEARDQVWDELLTILTDKLGSEYGGVAPRAAAPGARAQRRAGRRLHPGVADHRGERAARKARATRTTITHTKVKSQKVSRTLVDMGF